MELTVKWLTGHLGPRPISARSGESPQEFRLRRHVWRLHFRLFTAQHRVRHRLARASRPRPSRSGSDYPRSKPASPAMTVEPGYGAHPLRLAPPNGMPLPIASRPRKLVLASVLCARGDSRASLS